MSRCATAIRRSSASSTSRASLVDHATETLRQGLLLKFKPVNLDVLPLYIVLMGFFPPVLWMMLRQPNLGCWPRSALARGAAIRLEPARLSGRDLVLQPVLLAAPVRVRLLVRARLAPASRCQSSTRPPRSISASPISSLALVMTMAGKFPDFGAMFPRWLFDVQSERQDQSRALSFPASGRV